jgi:hypothetical protein
MKYLIVVAHPGDEVLGVTMTMHLRGCCAGFNMQKC